MSDTRPDLRLCIAIVSGAIVLLPASSFAQGAGASAGAGASNGGTSANTPNGTPSPGGASGGTTTSTTTTGTLFFPGGVAPPPPGQPVGGGNVTSSSGRARSGNDEDTFDLGRPSSSATAFGSADGPFFSGSGSGGGSFRSSGLAPGQVTIKKGDTLWDLCDTYFENPYQWPRIWSYNPEIQNPHWIYPGQVVRLRSGGGTDASDGGQGADGGGLIDRRRSVTNGTVFLRDEGYLDDASDDNWGEITGAPEDKMFLSDFDEVYVRLGGNREVKLGQEITVFRPIKRAGTGQIVQIQGTLKIDDWNAKEKIARAQIVETLEVIERGARVGPIARKFDVVPPTRNAGDVVAKVTATIQPHVFVGQNQVVFLDKGEKDGVVVGNRFFIVRKGDAWKKSLASDASAVRIAIEKESPAAVERVPTPKRDEALPEEVVGELRVVATRPGSATTLVTQSRGEIDFGDIAVARKGY